MMSRDQVLILANDIRQAANEPTTTQGVVPRQWKNAVFSFSPHCIIIDSHRIVAGSVKPRRDKLHCTSTVSTMTWVMQGNAWSLRSIPPRRHMSRPIPKHITCSARVVGVGSCGIDYLAAVAAFPRPDEKLRTQQLEVCPCGTGKSAAPHTTAARRGQRRQRTHRRRTPRPQHLARRGHRGRRHG